MKVFIIVLMLGFFINASSVNDCKCTKPEHKVMTRSGANEEIIQVERKPYKVIRGVVEDATGEPMPDVLVEVLDNPEYLLLDYPENVRQKKPQHRIAACITGSDGRFCFSNIPSGKYEMLASIEHGWNHSHVYVVVASRKRMSARTELKITMQVGT